MRRQQSSSSITQLLIHEYLLGHMTVRSMTLSVNDSYVISEYNNAFQSISSDSHNCQRPVEGMS